MNIKIVLKIIGSFSGFVLLDDQARFFPVLGQHYVKITLWSFVLSLKIVIPFRVSAMERVQMT